ncbi:MAG: 1-deoxy-D-xylulose-5-phosphate reductoisomerase [Pseudohongiellaceae bacterium]
MTDRATEFVTILGSTGSVGENTLDVISGHPHLQVHALSANTNVEKLARQCRQFKPHYAVMVDEDSAEQLATLLADTDTEVLNGPAGLLQIVADTRVNMVMAAVVGAAGLDAALAAVRHGKKVLLANKESLVMAGDLFMRAVAESGAILLPIDSEHNAIFQCLPHQQATANGKGIDALGEVRRVILTASGGPFLHMSSSALRQVTPQQACKHPRWEMGRKISVDSATLMNKGLEFIEACFLFGLEPQRVEVLIHPQSVVHSLVEYVDGSMLAQLAAPDMRVPIAYGLAWPQRMTSGAASLDLAKIGSLEFFPPDLDRFPCLRLGMEAFKVGGTAPAILNAANECAVQAFLDERIGFSDIPRIIESVLAKIPCEAAASLAIIQAADQHARILGNELIAKAK